MDLLDRVIWPGSDLLAAVDAVLHRLLHRFGAPADHPVWGELARAGVLPSAALVQIATPEVPVTTVAPSEPLPNHIELR